MVIGLLGACAVLVVLVESPGQSSAIRGVGHPGRPRRAAPAEMAPLGAAGLAPHSATPASRTGLRLLSQAAQACQTMTYQGVEVLGAGPDTSVVDVWHSPGGVTLAQAAPAAPHWSGEAPHIVLPASYLGGQALMGSVMLGMNLK